MSRSQRHSPALVRNEQKFSLGNQLTEDVAVLMAGCRSKRKSLTVDKIKAGIALQAAC
ncbi:hypothetical protein T4B_4973 [Trichinella pseudospiralis]|uniref:Uncharacterized protein n=2 Tax=Trichinella pseudospiralis TaxID=6337 RepID=A0A0V1G014_TRIPS|nr:hypothetical protein T4A_4787 [Trichinella pseudospiralis]KRY91624.1 hypothetical protein T4D_7025 [Trichinella pseudospiralis]KRZ34130.1 hypothetical protein T4B_4973 [Trichinella pseudospiralis]KRZ44926.1 hypothetical protein T4C_9741 [Trichinella pseudospiralis]